MRALILKIALPLLLLSSSAHSKSLIYFLVDADMPIEQRRVASDFIDELVSGSKLGYDYDLYLHINGISLFYPKMPKFSANSSQDVRSFLATVSQISSANDFLGVMRSRNPSIVVQSEPQHTFSIASKNLIGLKKDHGSYENVYFIQLSNLDFSKPVDTSGILLGDGWITSESSPMREFISGSQSRAFLGSKVFVVISEPKDAPLTWFSGKVDFWRKLYSSIGADVIAIKRIGNMPYGGGALLAESFINAITTDFQRYDRIMPKSTELIQTIDINTEKVNTIQ